MQPFGFDDRSDDVDEKLRLLQAAAAAGNLDLARSLADSIKQSLHFQRQLRPADEATISPADQFTAVTDLPKAWATWARGWKFCKAVRLSETVGIARAGEPVDVSIAFAHEQATDPWREVRVARLDEATGALVEVTSQVYDETRHATGRHCRLVFLADVAAHRSATYLIFYGNNLAERPDYPSDLVVQGEGFGLDVENRHFVARLSRQMGQLERLTYKRQHGLELYAGGKGHGEPPGIDWAHDYVDAGGFQKLRMRNWPDCPSYEVIRGPLLVRVRRWGFPYSPIHPVFTPSRIHMDQTYSFYAGLPYFFKQGTIDVVKDVTIEAMRDDEWVFSGYSFTDTVWFDSQGKLHEGSVPPGNAQDLWGVGFYNRTSGDSFIALWLEHAATGFDGPNHGGVPTLHYDGHGQLWSRYPAEHAELKAGTSIRQRNAYLVAPHEGEGTEAKVEQLRHQLLHPLDVQAADVPRLGMARARGTLARPGETGETAPLKPAIWKALRQVRDEQLYTIDSNIVDLGYVYDVRERNGTVTVLVTMPHRGRPVYEFLVSSGGGRVEPGIRERLLALTGVREVIVEATWNPPWSAARLTDAGRRALGLPD